MHKLYKALLTFLIFFLVILTNNIKAIPSENIVISQIKAGNSASSRLVEIYNNSDLSVDISDWCFYYSPPSNTTPYIELGCFSNLDPTIHQYIRSHTFALLASSQIGHFDIELISGLGTGNNGHVYLMDSIGNIVDSVGWGTAINAEGESPKIMSSTKTIERKFDTLLNTFIDTDNNANDFIDSNLRDPKVYETDLYDGLYDVTDLCSDIEGVQEEIEDGLINDGTGICLPPPPVDVCKNFPGVKIVPPGYDVDDEGNCIQHDECSNIDDIQIEIPDDFIRSDDNNCVLDLLPLVITELLPNAIGNDDGNEFIEIYNPNDKEVKLEYFGLFVGPDSTHLLNFPSASVIGPKQYLSFSNDDINFTLVNTTSTVKLWIIDGSESEPIPLYLHPIEGMAWALINNNWQYTNHPTPGLENLPSIIEVILDDEIVEQVELESCAANQYRNPLTNRCKLLSSNVSELAPCKDGQYRSEETNRCRSIISDVADLVPCAEGQERNPSTNRCRNIVSMPTADYAPEKTVEKSNDNTLLFVLLTVGLIVTSYGIWEWRVEIRKLFKKIKKFRNKK